MNREEPIISIIVPVYNAEQYLNRCVLSVVNQTLENFELILVDDGSNDRSAQICNEWAERDGRVSAIHQANGGSAKARNAGLRIARGQYIGFADGDDWLEPNMFQTMIECACKHDSDLVIVGHYDDLQGPGGEVLKETSRVPQSFSSETNGEYKAYFPKLLKESCFFQVWDKIYRRELIERHHVRFDESMPVGQDASFNIPLAPLVDRVDVLPIPLYHYSSREGSMSSVTFKESYLQSRVRAFEWAEQILSDWYPQTIRFFANGCIDQMGRLVEGLYKKRGCNRVYRNMQLKMIISSKIVQKCARMYPPSSLRNRFLAFAFKHRNITLLKFYARGILAAKRIKEELNHLSSR